MLFISLAVAFALLQLLADCVHAFQTNSAQRQTDLEFAALKPTRVRLRVLQTQSMAEDPGSSGHIEYSLSGLPPHCGRGMETLIYNGKLHHDWCTRVLVDPPAVMGALPPCKDKPALIDFCDEGEVDVVIRGERMSFGRLTGVRSNWGLAIELLFDKLLAFLALGIWCLAAAMVPFLFLDFLYGRSDD